MTRHRDIKILQFYIALQIALMQGAAAFAGGVEVKINSTKALNKTQILEFDTSIVSRDSARREQNHSRRCPGLASRDRCLRCHHLCFYGVVGMSIFYWSNETRSH